MKCTTMAAALRQATDHVSESGGASKTDWQRVFRPALSFLAASVLAWSAPASGQTVSGDVTWLDAAGIAHPARMHRVEIYGIYAGGEGAPGNFNNVLSQPGGNLHIDRVYTDQFGHYSSNAVLPPGYFPRAVAVSDTGNTPGGGFVDGAPEASPPSRPPLSLPMFGQGYYSAHDDGSIIDPVVDLVAPGPFSISDALYTGWYFSSLARPLGAPEVRAVYPLNNGTVYVRGAQPYMRVHPDNMFDWDVVLHEYGHHLSNVDNLDQSPGGFHGYGTSNVPLYGKLNGLRLAWGEGLGTYLGIAMQHVDPVGQNLPLTKWDVGDTFYTDSRNGLVDLETHTINWGGVTTEQGEGDELAVCRILWDLADPANETHDRISIGHVALYDVLNNISGLDMLEDVWDHYFNISSDAERIDFGAIFEEYGISPHPFGTSPINTSLLRTDEPPTFQWERGNFSANDEFQLIVFDDDLSNRLLDISVPGDVSNYTLTSDEWGVLRVWSATVGEEFNFVVAGSDTTDFTTGSYWSDAYPFWVVPEPATCVLLSTGALGMVLGAISRNRRKKNKSRKQEKKRRK